MRKLQILGVAVTSMIVLPTLGAQTSTHPETDTKTTKGKTLSTSSSRSLSAEKLLSHPIVDDQDEEKGQIEELVLDPNGHRVLFALVSCEEHEDKLFAVPVRQFRVTQGEDEDELTLRWTPSEAEISTLPSIAKDDWDDATSLTFANRVRSHFGNDMGGDYRTGTGTGTGTDTPRAVGEVDRDSVLPTKIVRVSKVIGSDLDDLNGEDVGELKNLLISPDSGKVCLAVVETDGGILTTGDTVGVPLEILEHQDSTEGDDESKCRLTVTKELLESAPKFDRDEVMKNEKSYVQQVYRHFGTPMPDARGSNLRDPIRKGSDMERDDVPRSDDDLDGQRRGSRGGKSVGGSGNDG